MTQRSVLVKVHLGSITTEWQGKNLVVGGRAAHNTREQDSSRTKTRVLAPGICTWMWMYEWYATVAHYRNASWGRQINVWKFVTRGRGLYVYISLAKTTPETGVQWNTSHDVITSKSNLGIPSPSKNEKCQERRKGAHEC